MGGIGDFLFGSDTEQVGTAISPGQSWLQQILRPMMTRGINAGLQGGQLYPTAPLPQTPVARGYSPAGYQSPSAQYDSPAAFAGGYTDILNRMMEPYGDALGGTTGFSGAGQNVLGSAMGQIAPNIMNQYTQYQMPYAQMQNQAGMFGADAQNTARQFGASAQNQMGALGYGGALQQMGNINQAYASPWNFASQYSGTYGSPMVEPGQEGFVQNSLGTAMTFGLGSLFGLF